jgi:uncharacterized BrkB/YihY/UPF0761 family membrane protein
MPHPDLPDPLEPAPLEIEAQPSVAGRLARWTERARILRGRVEDARERHPSIDLCFKLVERDSTVGGGLLAGALAYRLFVVLLPAAVLLVSGIGVYAGAVDRTPAAVAKEAGLTGLVAAQVAEAASSNARWLIFLAMVPTLLYAIAKLYRSIVLVFAIVWEGSGRGVRISRKGLGLFIAAMAFHFAAVELVGWVRRNDQYVGLGTLLVYVGLVGGAWLVVSTQLPHGDAGWRALVPGAALFGIGLLCVNVFNVYVTTRLVEGRADTYGALGVATALLFSLVLVGRLMVASAVLNASLYERQPRSPGGT